MGADDRWVLMIVERGAPPPWAEPLHDYVFPTVENLFATINLRLVSRPG